jgi:hypothetical protein
MLLFHTLSAVTKYMTKALLGLASIMAVAIPALSFAHTYHYVSVSGEVKAVEADTAAEAIMTPSDIHPNSGVAIDRGLIEPGMNLNAPGVPLGTGGGNIYAYVDITGAVETIVAQSPTMAIASATNIHPNSGVAIMTGDTLAE